MDKLSHVDEQGRLQMVDVSSKNESTRTAVAEGRVSMSAEAMRAVRENTLAKGDVFAVARIAGIQAAKKTSELIPLCHPLALTDVAVDFVADDARNTITVRTEVRCVGRTGVEMEALVAASLALLTIYDMAKAVDRSMTISDVRLVSKAGGKSGTWTR